MREYEKEKRDVDIYINSIVKKMSNANKQRAADFLLGVLVAENIDQKETDAPLSYPQGGVAQCG